MNPTMQDDAKLEALTESDIPEIAALAREIWLSHYTPIIGVEQVEYMIGRRFTAENLRRYLESYERWMSLLRVSGELVGYCSFSLSETPGELKLEQLYLLPAMHGRKLGGMMYRFVESEARRLNCRTMMLTVNRHNANSIAIYQKLGFTVREEARFDIGQGYVMDDYVMEKLLTF